MEADTGVALTPLDPNDATTFVANSLDTTRLNELYGEDVEYAASMFETFLEIVLPEFDLLGGLIQQQQWAKVSLLAHKVRPTLVMVGLSDLEVVLRQIEELAIANADSESIRRLWHTLHADILCCKPLIQAEWQRYLTKNKP